MKSKYFIVFPYTLVDEIKWPDRWGNQCAGNLAPMLQEVLKVKSIGSEIKLIWNDAHRRMIVKDHSVTDEQLDDYIKANCSLLSFRNERIMKRAEKALKTMGAKNYIILENYRDVILQQAFYHHHKHFNQTGPQGTTQS